MAIGNRVCGFAGAVLDLIIRILYLPIQLFAVLFSLLPLILYGLLLLGIAGISYYGIAQNGDIVIEEVVFFFNCRVAPFYENTLESIVDFIHNAFNPVICWWDALVIAPQQIGRVVIFPTLLECGLLDYAIALANLFQAISQDFVVGYISTGIFFTQLLDFTTICNRWQNTVQALQNIICCGCGDLCLVFTQLPVIPMMFTSDQLKSDNWWCYIANALNGNFAIIQEILRIARLVLFQQPGSLRPDFRLAFDLFCESSRCFWKSWEEALQKTWDTFVPFDFVWVDFLCYFDKMTCIMLRTLNLLINQIFHSDQILLHFTAKLPPPPGQDYWRDVTKQDFMEIINLVTTATTFETITEMIPNYPFDMTISSYALDPRNEGKLNGDPNPLFNQTTLADCACIFIERLLCDPTNNGTTCAEKYNNTLYEDVDFCCFYTSMQRAIVDTSAFLFEGTLHTYSSTDSAVPVASDFVIFLDRQPFSTFIKTSVAEMFSCLYQIFRAVETFGFCIEKVLSEATLFVLCFQELFFRVIISLITLPYFETYLDPLENFITRPGDEALNQALGFLDRIADTMNPQGFINCLCYLINTGFQVPPAGCGTEIIVNGTVNITVPECTPTGFVDPMSGAGASTRMHRIFGEYGITPIHHYQYGRSNYRGAAKAFASVSHNFEQSLDRIQHYNGRLSTLPPTNLTIGCDTCFDACCLPSKTTILVAQTSAAVFRAVNAAFQSRLGNGSGYWDGTDCTMGVGGQLEGTCLASDVTMFIGNLLAPLTCVCNFIQLVIPPIPGIDPCCFFTLLGDLLGCLFVIGINIANSVAGDPNFQYIKDDTMLIADFNTVGDIAIATFDCLCDGIRVVFNFIQNSANLNANFDPCCIPQKFFNAAVDAVKLAFQTVISISTLEQESSNCFLFLRDDLNPLRANCVVPIDQLPFVVRVDEILDQLLAPPNPNVLNQCAGTINVTADPQFAQNQATEGLATCYCTLVNNVLNAVFKNTELASECPLNLCCIIYRISDFFRQLFKFSIRFIAAVWQNWEKVTSPSGEVDIPSGVVDFFFCNEYYPGGSVIQGQNGMTSTPPFNISNIPDKDLKCGRLEPTLQALNDALVDCICSSEPKTLPGIGDVLDNFLEYFLFTITSNNPIIFGNTPLIWPKCLCSGGRVSEIASTPNQRGIVRPFADILVIGLRQVILLVRNIGNPTYWRPEFGSFLNPTYADTLVNNVQDIEQSWIARFLGPFADAICRFVTNLGCLLSMILGDTCELQRYNVLGSTINYILQGAIRALVLIEGIVKLFTQELPGLCVGNQAQVAGSNSIGIASTGNETLPECAPSSIVGTIFGLPDPDSMDRINSILVATIQFVADALFGVSQFACSGLCFVPEGGYNVIGGTMVSPEGPACKCYQESFYKAPQDIVTTFEGCRLAFNLPNGSICPGNAVSCDYNVACGNAPGTELIASTFPVTFRCNRSLTPAGPGGVISYGASAEDQERQRAISNWVVVEVPILYPYGFAKPTGCRQVNGQPIVLPDGTTISDPATDFPASDLASPETQFKGVQLVPTATTSWSTNTQTQAYPFVPLVNPGFAPNGYCQLTNNPPLNVQQLALQFLGPGINTQNGTQQPLCTREYCYENGFCKNDQLSSCNPNEQPYDGIIMAFIKYLRCLVSEEGIDNSLLFGVIDLLAILISIIWQFSAGIIKLAVSLTVLTFQLMLNFNPLTRLLFGIFIIIDFIEKFVAIFTQPVIANAGNDPQPARSLFSDPNEEYGVLGSLKLAFGTNMDHCIDDPVKCACDHNLIQECDSASQNTVADVVRIIGDVFDGATECDSLVHHLKDEEKEWQDIPYAERYEYIDCVGKLVQGQQYAKLSGGIWPKDFFYSPDGWYKLIMNAHNTISTRAEQSHAKTHTHKRRANFERSGHKKWVAYYYEMHTRGLLARKHIGLSKDSMAYEFAVEMDRFWYKYRTGYYGYLTRQAGKNIRRNGLSPVLGSLKDNILDVADAFGELKKGYQMSKHHASKAYDAAGNVVEKATETLTSSWSEMLKSIRFRLPQKPPKKHENLFFNMKRGRTTANNVAQNTGPSIWSGVGSVSNLRIDPEIKRLLTWSGPGWTPEKTYNYEALHRIYHQIYNILAPHYMDQSTHERFVLNGNCRLVDGIVDETTMIVDFCLNDWVYNLPNQTYNTTLGNRTIMGRISNYVKDTSMARRGGFIRKYRDRASWQEFKGKQRFRLNAIERHKRHIIDRRIYRVARQTTTGLLGGFNLIEWLVCLVEDIFNISASQSIDEFFADLQAWFNNPNTDAMDWPDVGAVYWLKFFLVCEFPINVSCTIGFGIEEAFQRVTLAFIVALVILWATGLLSLLAIGAGILIYIIALFIVAYHWTPICLAVFPSFTLGYGISVPFLPIPIGFWALPMCLWDDLDQFFDKYLSTCWDFLLNPAHVNGDVCPACDQRIDFVNCLEVGIGDGLTNLLYLLFRWLGPGFCDVILAISQTLIGRLFPGFNNYLNSVLNSFKTATDDQLSRLNLCAVTTAGSSGAVLFLFAIGAALLLYIVPALYGIIVALFNVFAQTNVYESLVTQGEPTSYDELPGEDPGGVDRDDEEEYLEEDEEEIAKPIGQGLVDSVARGIHRLLKKPRKRKVE